MLVSEPEAVKVDEFTEDDYGRIIGRGGRTANALRTVVKAAAVREQRRVLVDATAELDEDEYLAADLVGCSVVDGGRSLGTVTALLGLPSVEALELDTGLLVPMVRDAIRSVDIAARRIDVDLSFLGE